MYPKDSAKTVAEAEAQQLTMPSSYDHWKEFAQLLDGYAISSELGVEWKKLRSEYGLKYKTNSTDLSLLEARLLLFWEARAERFRGGAKSYHKINSLLVFIAEKIGQAFTPLTEDEIGQRIQHDMEDLRNSFIYRKRHSDAEE